MAANGYDAEARREAERDVDARIAAFADAYTVRATPTLTKEMVDFKRWADNRAEQLQQTVAVADDAKRCGRCRSTLVARPHNNPAARKICANCAYHEYKNERAMLELAQRQGVPS